MFEIPLAVRIIAALWYICYVLTKMAGPFFIFVRLRDFRGGHWHGRSPSIVVGTYDPDAPGGTRIIGKDPILDGALDCIVCIAPYVAVGIFAWVHFLPQFILVIDVFAACGLMLWVHGFTQWRVNF